MTSPWQAGTATALGSLPRVFLRPDERTTVPPNLLGMPLVARISEHLTGLLYASLAFFLTLSFTPAAAQPADAALYSQGEKIFKGNCAACHKPDAKLTGPALKGVQAKWEGKGDIYAWVKNSQAYLKTGNELATKIFEEYKPTLMTPVALKNAGLEASDIDYVNAHGTSTMADGIELRAVERLLGDRAKTAAMSSTKSMTGHLLGAAGAIEAAFSVLAIRDQVAPPTINLEDPEFETPLDLCANVAKPMAIDVAMSNSFGFGGTNAAVIFKKIA